MGCAHLSSGIETLDKLLGGNGFRRGSNILVRGQPGTGKTTLALQIAQHALDLQDTSVVYLSVEEDDGKRALGQITESLWGKPYNKFLEGNEVNEISATARRQRFKVVDIARYWDEQLSTVAKEDGIRSHVRNIKLQSPKVSTAEARQSVDNHLNTTAQH